MQEEDESVNLHVMAIESEDGDLNIVKVHEALMEDPVSVLLGDLILNAWPESCKDFDQELKPYWIHCFNLSIVDGIILLGEDCIVVPVSLCEQFLKALHYTHQGINKTLVRVRSHAYWPGIAHDVLQLMNVKFVLKTMLIQAFLQCLTVMPMGQDSSVVQILVKLMDIST